MQDRNTNLNLALRSDTFLGTCEAIGQDFGFSPNWLRVLLGVMVLWSPEASLLSYLALSVAVLASRLIFPKAKPVEAVKPTVSADNEEEALPLAA